MNAILMRTIGSVLLLFALMPIGCSYTTVPRSVPLVPEKNSTRFNGVSFAVVNGEKDNTVFWVQRADNGPSSFKANRRAWCGALVEAMARELSRRGAVVRAGSGRTFSASLPEINFAETRDVYQFSVKAVVNSSRGWSKAYTGTASVNATSVLSIQDEADRLAGRAVADAVRAMLEDSEFLSQVSGR